MNLPKYKCHKEVRAAKITNVIVHDPLPGMPCSGGFLFHDLPNFAPTCGTDTRMGLAIAETYSRDPSFYSGTFCCHCRSHFPLDQFVWKGTNEVVGS